MTRIKPGDRCEVCGQLHAVDESNLLEMLRREEPPCLCGPCCTFVPPMAVRILTQWIERSQGAIDGFRFIGSLPDTVRCDFGRVGKAVIDAGAEHAG